MADTRQDGFKSDINFLLLLIVICVVAFEAGHQLDKQRQELRSLRQQLSDQTIVSIEVSGAKIAPCYTFTKEPTK